MHRVFRLTRTGMLPGDTVAVVGLGPIGLIGVELAFILGASEVFAIDPVANRRSHAAGLGAIALDPAQALPIIMDGDKRCRRAQGVRGIRCQSSRRIGDQNCRAREHGVIYWPASARCAIAYAQGVV